MNQFPQQRTLYNPFDEEDEGKSWLINNEIVPDDDNELNLKFLSL